MLAPFRIYSKIKLTPSSLRPSELWGLNKGGIEIGRDTNFTVVNLNLKKVFTNEEQGSRVSWTPFAGMNMTVWPTHTILSGQVVMKRGELHKRAGKPAI